MVDSFGGKVKIIEALEAEQKSQIYATVGMAVFNNRLKNTLQVNF